MKVQFGSRRALLLTSCVVLGAGLTVLAAPLQNREFKSGIPWKEPAIINPGSATQAPADAVVLFDGQDMSAWNGGENWKVADGVATAAGGGITSKQAFGDVQLHVEFATPAEVSGSGQGRGNSGIYLMECYEVQVLDSYDNTTYFDGQCAAIYKQYPPLVNACRPPGEWQSYDIIFTAPRFGEDGQVESPAYVTVLQNGVLVQNHVELKGKTFFERAPAYEPHAEKLPIHIQFHGNPVRFRNIWARDVNQLPVQEPQAEE